MEDRGSKEQQTIEMYDILLGHFPSGIFFQIVLRALLSQCFWSHTLAHVTLCFSVTGQSWTDAEVFIIFKKLSWSKTTTYDLQ